jgi:xylulokinase
MPHYFLGIDSGTQSTKTICVDGDTGEILAAASQQYDLMEGLPAGHKEQHPQTWIEACEATIKQVVSQLRAKNLSPDNIRALGVSGQQHGFVPLDDRDEVIRPAKLWCDTSSAPQCEALIKKLGGLKKVIALTGNGVPAGFTASKILWLKQREPQHYKRLATVLLPHDYINFWLTGNKVMEYGDASGTALLDVRKRQWSDKMLRAIDPKLRDKLPPLQSSDKAAGTIRPALASRLSLPSSLLVSAGGGDNMMGAIGTGNTRSGCVTASFGTSGTIYACSEKPVIDPAGEIAAFCDSTNRWMPLLCTMNVTVATELVRNVFHLSHEEMDAAICKAPVGANGLLLLPYLEGERTPNVPQGTGVFFGINTGNWKQENICRATMEGVTLGMNYGLNRLRALGIRPRQIRVTGGGSNSPVWRQIMADIFNTEVVCTQTAEGAAFGAALQALWCWKNQCGPKEPIAAITDRLVKLDDKTRCLPNRDAVKTYQRLQILQNKLSSVLRLIFPMQRG